MNEPAEDAVTFGPITPLPVPEGASCLLLFGGMFDPPHLAHTALAAQARDLGPGPDAWLLFVPAARSPLKESAPGAGDHDRIRMVDLAIRELPRATLWTDEIDRAAASTDDPSPSYWIDTLRRARKVLPPATEVRFLIGADQALAFHCWRSFRDILSLASPLILLRAPATSPQTLLDGLRNTGEWTEHDLSKWQSWILPTAVVDPSSTDVRTSLARGDIESAARLLHPDVLDYIQQHRLYTPLV